MDLITWLLVVGMVLNLVENTLVAVTALLVYHRQTIANAEMEKRINKAIEDVKIYMASDKILGRLKKDLLKTMRGWLGGETSATNRSINKTIKGLGGSVKAIRALREAKTFEEKAIVIAEYGSEKLEEMRKKKELEKQRQTKEPEISTVEDFKNANMTPEQYRLEYDKGLEIVKQRESGKT